MIKLVVFDMAGTTIRDDDAVHRCLAEALAADGVHASRDEVNRVMGLPKPIAIRMLLEQLHPANLSDERVERVHNDFLHNMIRHYETFPGISPMPHAEEAFGCLKSVGVRVALDTGFSRPIVLAILKRLNWTQGVLDATIASDEVARGRPFPDMIYRAMQLTGVYDPSAVAKVGDTPSDLLEGTAAGCGFVIGVTNGSHTREELQPHPHTHLIESLRELPVLVLGRVPERV
jgi:phosphonatase-like hydrolase